MLFKMQSNGYYGVVYLRKDVFDKLNQDYFISNTTGTTRYMCANDRETSHLISLGVDLNGVVCDWYRVCLG